MWLPCCSGRTQVGVATLATGRCFLLHYLWVSGCAFTFESLEKEKQKKTFATLDGVIKDPYVHTHKRRPRCSGQAPSPRRVSATLDLCCLCDASLYSRAALRYACAAYDGLWHHAADNQRLENHKVLVQSQHRQSGWQPYFLSFRLQCSLMARHRSAFVGFYRCASSHWWLCIAHLW